MNDIKRGEIFYIRRGGATASGSEQQTDRPAVVVSNDLNNLHSDVVEVVYLTTQPKTDLPTHVTVRSTGRISTVLCEQVHSVSMERVGTYAGQCTDAEMANIDIALMISLQLDGGKKTSKKYTETIDGQQEEIKRLREQLESAQEAMTQKTDEIDRLQSELAVVKDEMTEMQRAEKAAPVFMSEHEALIRAETERDVFKSLYENVLKETRTGGTA